jgi:uncharacterized membrane protein (UPF0127 family)
MTTAAACGSAAPAPKAAPEEAPAGLAKVPLTIHSANGDHKFTVEVAATPEEQEHGLMFRKSVPPNTGMIFPYDPPAQVSFWMKNTLVPLDMVFIGPDGKISRIAENTTPMSLDPVASIDPISAVLELAGGRSAQLGLKAGDKVDWQH